MSASLLNKRILHHRLVGAFFVGILASILSSAVMSPTAKAFDIAGAPPSVDTAITNTCNSGSGTAQATWLAPRNDSDSTTISVAWGTKTVPMAIYGVRYKCKASSPTTQGASRIVHVTSPDGTTSGIDEFQYSMNYKSGTTGTYGVAKQKDVTFTYSGTFTVDRNITITMYSAGKLYYYGAWHCADEPYSGYKWDSCNAGDSKITLTIDVGPAPWNLNESSGVDPGAQVAGGTVNFKFDLWNAGPGNVVRSLPVYANAKWTQHPANPSLVGTNADTCPQAPSFYNPPNANTNKGCYNSFTIPTTALIGQKYCQRLDYYPENPAKQANPEASYGPEVCVVVGIKPKFQVWGLDVRVGGQATGSLTTLSGRTYGSWVEYGIFSAGQNNGIASGSRFVSGSGPAPASWHPLTFANTTPQFGEYGPIQPPKTLVNALVKLCGASWPGGTKSIPGNAPVDNPGVVCADRVNIDGNITVSPTGNTNNLNSIKQNIIIAKDIAIAPGVTSVNAWLIAVPHPENSDDPFKDADLPGAGGRITTCGPHFTLAVGPATSLSSALCREQLTITGPVITNKLYLRRTHGSGNPSTTNQTVPAEIFNFRADAFLWAFKGGNVPSSDPVPQTVSIRELPPRF